MGYEPDIYWVERFRAQGPSYVSRAGATKEQQELQRDNFRNALSMVMGGYPYNIALDYGCGVGRFSGFIGANSRTYVGADIVTEALLEASKNRAGIYVHEDALRFFAPATFDAVFAVTVFQHMPEIPVSTILNILKPNGHVYIIDNLGDAPASEHEVNRTPEEYADLFGATLESKVLIAEFSGKPTHYAIRLRV